MPFKSDAQRKFLWANHPEIAKRWEDETPDDKKLPKHVVKKKSKDSIMKKLIRNRKK